MVRNVMTVRTWGPDEIRRESEPYCGSCTLQELQAWDREHGQQPDA
ncbi:hypothetical protein RKD48_001165 [Streptomyces ambofaciens]